MDAVEAPPAPPATSEPPAAEDPLDLDEPLELDEPLDLDEPLAAEPPPEPDKPRSAADWLGLGEDLGAEDPLGLDDPALLEAAARAVPEASQSAAAVDDDLPDELQNTLARYEKAMSRLRDGRGADAADPPAAPPGQPGGSAERPASGIDGSEELLEKYLKAVSRQRTRPDDADRAPARAGRAPTVSRETLNQLRKRRVGSPEAPAAEEPAAAAPARDHQTGDRAAPRARQRRRPAPRAASGWGSRAATFALLLLAALPVQWLVYRHLGATFALADLGAGLSALLPAALILLLARPVSGKGRFVMVVGSAAIALIGSAGFAYGLSLLQNQLPQGASLLFGLLLTLGLFTAVWGPLFLILVPILSRMSLPARSGS